MKEICEILEDVSLKNYNTYRIDTRTKYLALPSSVEELRELLEYYTLTTLLVLLPN